MKSYCRFAHWTAAWLTMLELFSIFYLHPEPFPPFSLCLWKWQPGVQFSSFPYNPFSWLLRFCGWSSDLEMGLALWNTNKALHPVSVRQGESVEHLQKETWLNVIFLAEKMLDNANAVLKDPSEPAHVFDATSKQEVLQRKWWKPFQVLSFLFQAYTNVPCPRDTQKLWWLYRFFYPLCPTTVFLSQII